MSRLKGPSPRIPLRCPVCPAGVWLYAAYARPGFEKIFGPPFWFGVADGAFRSDLFYRLNVFMIQLPPLRERRGDIPDLAEHFLNIIAAKENKQQLHISIEVIKLLKNYAWKGNIRELRNVMERAAILADDIILPEHLPFEIQSQMENPSNGLSLSSVERNHIQKVLQHTNGNKTKAAEYLGIGLTTLYRKLEEYAIK